MVMAEKCTNTSSPVWRWMNPYPFEALNHFTVPCSFTAQPHMHDPDRIGTSDIGIALPLLVRFLGIAKQSPAPQSWCDCRLRSPKCRDILQPVKKAASLSLQPPRTSQKVIQDQQTLRNSSTKRGHCPRV